MIVIEQSGRRTSMYEHATRIHVLDMGAIVRTWMLDRDGARIEVTPDATVYTLDGRAVIITR